LGLERAPGVIEEGPGPGRARVAPGSAVAVEPPEAGLPAAIGVGQLLKEGLELLPGYLELLQDLGDLLALGQGLKEGGPGKGRTVRLAQETPRDRAASRASSSSCQ